MADIVLMHGADYRDDLTAGYVNFYVPDAETEPEAIAEAQRAVVAEWHARGWKTPAALSEVTDLPLWNVARCMAELGIGPPVKDVMARAAAEKAECRRVGDRIAALLATENLTPSQIAQRVDASESRVRQILATTDRFVRVNYSKATEGAVWTLRKERQAS